MPISAAQKALYPADWDTIRARVRHRAQDVCEGSPAYPKCRARNGAAHPVTGATVVCTTAHLDHDPENSAMENLRFWCQRCHNTYDQEHRQRNAAATRRAAKGNRELF